MAIKTVQKPNIWSIPASRPVARAEGFRAGLKLVAGTVGFVLFAAAAGAVLWFAWQAFQNQTYKIVTAFVDSITTANVTSRYVIWVMKR